MKFKRQLFTNALFYVCISIFFTNCQKETNDKPSGSVKQTENRIEYNYIVNGKAYPVMMQQRPDSSFIVISEINDTLSNILHCPNSTLLQDPFNPNTYFVFKTEKESKIKNAEIIAQMNDFEIRNGATIQKSDLKAGGVVGSIVVYEGKYFSGPIGNYNPLLTSDGGYSSVGSYNDKISSYKVWCNTKGTREDGKRYVIRFYEHGNYKGHVLTAYGNFTNWNSGGDYQLSWSDSNLAGTLMDSYWVHRTYWNDEISSFKWTLE